MKIRAKVKQQVKAIRMALAKVRKLLHHLVKETLMPLGKVRHRLHHRVKPGLMAKVRHPLEEASPMPRAKGRRHQGKRHLKEGCLRVRAKVKQQVKAVRMALGKVRNGIRGFM